MKERVRYLVLEAKKGCEDSLEELFYMYRPIVFRLQGMYFLKDFDGDDWLQEGLICFYESLQRYNPKVGASIGIYFKRNFENRIKSHLRKQAALKRKGMVGAISWEAMIEDEGPDAIRYTSYRQWAPAADDQLVAEESLAAFSDSLSPLEECSFADFVLGTNAKVTARNLDTSTKRTNDALERARRKFFNCFHLQ